MRERRAGSDQYPGRRRCRRVLRQSRYLRDALRRRVGHRSADARRADPLRGHRHRRSRRLRAHRRSTRGGAAASWPRIGQRAGQPAQRPARPSPDGARRRRPRHLSQEVRRPTGIRYRRARRHRLGLGAPDGRHRRRRGRRRRGDHENRCHQTDFDADPARRHLLDRWRAHRRRIGAATEAGRRRHRGGGVGRGGVAIRRTRRCS